MVSSRACLIASVVAILETVRYSIPDAPNDTIENGIKRWLQNSVSDLRRKERKSLKTQKSSSTDSNYSSDMSGNNFEMALEGEDVCFSSAVI